MEDPWEQLIEDEEEEWTPGRPNVCRKIRGLVRRLKPAILPGPTVARRQQRDSYSTVYLPVSRALLVYRCAGRAGALSLSVSNRTKFLAELQPADGALLPLYLRPIRWSRHRPASQPTDGR